MPMRDTARSYSTYIAVFQLHSELCSTGDVPELTSVAEECVTEWLPFARDWPERG